MNIPKHNAKKDEDIIHNINCTISDIYTGITKKLKIKKKDYRTMSNDETEKILQIVIKPGYKEGTKIRFEKEGNIYPGSIPADIVFIIKILPDKDFKRINDDLHIIKEINLKQAQKAIFITYHITKW